MSFIDHVRGKFSCSSSNVQKKKWKAEAECTAIYTTSYICCGMSIYILSIESSAVLLYDVLFWADVPQGKCPGLGWVVVKLLNLIENINKTQYACWILGAGRAIECIE